MKKLLSIAAAICMTVSLGACTAQQKADTEAVQEEPYLILFPSNFAVDEGDIEIAEDQINQVFKENGENIAIQLKKLSFTSYDEELSRALAGNNRIDIAVTMESSLIDESLKGNLLPMNDLLNEYGQPVVKSAGNDVIRSASINGTIYGIPNIRDYAIISDSVFLDTKMMKKYGINPSDIADLDDLENAFLKVHEADPSIPIATTQVLSLLSSHYTQNYPVGVLDDSENKYIDLYTSDEYKNFLERINRWKEEGLIGMELNGDQVKAPDTEAFAIFRAGKPGDEVEVSQSRNADYKRVTFGKDIITSSAYTLVNYCIPRQAHSSSESMHILDILYTNQDANNALAKVMPSWVLPNLFLTDVPDGYSEDIWKQLDAFNKNAVKTEDAEFVFDPSPVMKQYTDVCSVLACYRPVLENGLISAQDGLDMMNKELQDAGIQDVITEKNRQYTLWKNAES